MDDMQVIADAISEVIGPYKVTGIKLNHMWFRDSAMKRSDIGIEINGTEVQVGYRCRAHFNLTNPDSIKQIAEAIKECIKHLECTNCSFLPDHKLPDKRREYIAVNCHTNCDDLCGKMGMVACPLK